MAVFPEVLSAPIRVGDDYKSPYQWAAQIAPEGQLSIYKDALLWHEGGEFGCIEALKAHARKTVAFLADERDEPIDLSAPFYVMPERDAAEERAGVAGGAGSPVPPPPVAAPVPVPYPNASASQSEQGWTTKTKRARKPKKQLQPLTCIEFASRVFDVCVDRLNTDFCYTGPSISMRDIDRRFDRNGFTSNELKSRLRALIKTKGQASQLVRLAKRKHRFAIGSGAMKGNNFNFKIQANGGGNRWHAVAQIHLIWE